MSGSGNSSRLRASGSHTTAAWWNGYRGELSIGAVVIELHSAPCLLMTGLSTPAPVERLDYLPDRGIRNIVPPQGYLRTMHASEVADLEKMLAGVARAHWPWVYRSDDKWPTG